MFESKKRLKETIDAQLILIKNRDNFIQSLKEQSDVLYNEKKQLADEKEDLRDFKKEVTKIINKKATIVDKYDEIRKLIL